MLGGDISQLTPPVFRWPHQDFHAREGRGRREGEQWWRAGDHPEVLGQVSTGRAACPEIPHSIQGKLTLPALFGTCNGVSNAVKLRALDWSIGCLNQKRT